MGMVPSKEQMGELQLESFKGVAISSIKGASEHAVIGVLGLIMSRSFDLHVPDQPVSDPKDMGCPSPCTALSPLTIPAAYLPHDSPMDLRPPPPNLPEPLILVSLPTLLVTQEEQALLDGTSHLTIWEEDEGDSNKEDPLDMCYKH